MNVMIVFLLLSYFIQSIVASSNKTLYDPVYPKRSSTDQTYKVSIKQSKDGDTVLNVVKPSSKRIKTEKLELAPKPRKPSERTVKNILHIQQLVDQIGSRLNLFFHEFRATPLSSIEATKSISNVDYEKLISKLEALKEQMEIQMKEWERILKSNVSSTAIAADQDAKAKHTKDNSHDTLVIKEKILKAHLKLPASTKHQILLTISAKPLSHDDALQSASRVE